ncbi:hypothetical protein NUW54_g5109 [Trametes sanguinea]|uniref:Uncharacterized protein n=1 Tax=Trametes sanguinea TaxID=158606 RepID=A0ACC1PZ28_9APHY|nr:hypothetical protein NUW54_g5109 [Trametes sanguinea]
MSPLSREKMSSSPSPFDVASSAYSTSQSLVCTASRAWTCLPIALLQLLHHLLDVILEGKLAPRLIERDAPKKGKSGAGFRRCVHTSDRSQFGIRAYIFPLELDATTVHTLRMLPIMRTNLLNVFPRTPGLPSLTNTFGAILIGSYIGFIIYGLNLYQTYHYYKAFPNDRLYLKLLVSAKPVGVVLSMETWHTVLCMHTCYHYLVTNFFNPPALLDGCVPINLVCISAVSRQSWGNPVGSQSDQTLFSPQGLSIISCQTFFVRRVYLLVGWRWRLLIAVVIIFLLAELGLAIAATIETFLKPTFAQFEHVTWIISVAFGFSAVADIILTTVLICALRKCRSGIKSTDSLLDTLIIYAISTGLLTGVFDLLTFIFALVLPNNLIFMGIDIVATKREYTLRHGYSQLTLIKPTYSSSPWQCILRRS